MKSRLFPENNYHQVYSQNWLEERLDKLTVSFSSPFPWYLGNKQQTLKDTLLSQDLLIVILIS